MSTRPKRTRRIVGTTSTTADVVHAVRSDPLVQAVAAPDDNIEDDDEEQPNEVQQPPQILPTSVRDRQRAVAEREASRLARPDGSKSLYRLSHADRNKSAVASTPSGVVLLPSTGKKGNEGETADEEWCGPWAVAHQMIAKREDAKRRREEMENNENNTMSNHPLDDPMQDLLMEQTRQEHPSTQWKSSVLLRRGLLGKRESLYSKRQRRWDVMQQRRKIPSLFDLCTSFLAENIEHVESLGIDTDSHVRTSVMNRLIAQQLLDDDAFLVLAEEGIDTLEVSDGSNITEQCLSKRLQLLLFAGLKYLMLDQCGHCFAALAVQTMTSTANQNQLRALSIGGAYGLQDVDAARLVQCFAPASLGFKACNLLGKTTCQSLCDTYASSFSSLIDFVLEDIPLSSDDLQVLLSKPDAWKNLKNLSFRRVSGLDDTFFHKMMGMCSSTLELLDLTDNVQLTDSVLASLRCHNVANRLHTLILHGLKQLTATGLEAFFTVIPMESDSTRPQPTSLRTLNLSQCSHDAVTDEVIRLVTGGAPSLIDTIVENTTSEGSQTSPSSLITPPSQAKHNYQALGSGGLVSLHVQGSSLLTDTSLEYLASPKGATYRTMTELNVSFCPNISDQGLGYLIDQCETQLRRIDVWGNAQLTDNLYDGHRRVDDPSFEVVGIWMKKSSSRTIR